MPVILTAETAVLLPHGVALNRGPPGSPLLPASEHDFLLFPLFFLDIYYDAEYFDSE